MNFVESLKNLTLPISMLTGTLLYLLFAEVSCLNVASQVLSPIVAVLLPVTMFAVLFVTFCKVDFRKMHLTHWHGKIAFFQILLTAITAFIILYFKLRGNSLILAEAALTCIIGPCAAAAPVITVKLGGNLEDMTTYTFLSNALTAILIPIVFPLIDQNIGFTFTQFLLILYKVSIILIAPMALAYLVKHYMSRLHTAILSIKDLSFYLWAFCLAIVTGTTIRNIAHARTSVSFIVIIAFTALILCILQFYIGRKSGSRIGATVECGQALGQKNTTFAIWIASAYLNPLSSVGPGCYIIWQNTVNSIQLWKQQKRTAKKEATA